MRIAHVSDIHIRNFKYRDEYRAAFENLYLQLRGLRPDLIINTGDTVHSKLAVSPELFDDVANHCLEMCRIAPYWIILGNHDLNLKNKTRTDAISPIVRALQGRTEWELRMPGYHEKMLRGQFEGIHFWNYDIRQHEHKFDVNPDDINIGLFHGSISGCQTDSGFVLDDGEADVSKFDLMDYVLLGDIHKRQSFRGGRMQYPGSLIQQNYGEEPVKGFLCWDIGGKDHFDVSFHPVKAPGRFFTLQVPADLSLNITDVPKRSRIRAIVDGELTPSKRIELEKLIREHIDPLEVIIPDAVEREKFDELSIDRLVADREMMLKDHLTDLGCAQDEIENVIRLFNQLEREAGDEGQARGTSWSLKNIAWDDMMNYGDGNSVDLTKLQGLVGIFAPNASGKSSIFDIMLETLFDRVSKEVPRNIDLINDNKDRGTMCARFEAGEHEYTINRMIDRITYGQRKLTETKQWGKTSLEFEIDGQPLNGTSRPETEKQIRSVIGTFEDFTLTTMVSQNPIFGIPGGGDIINCKETDRRKILFRFLDLDIYEKISGLCKDELKAILGSIKGKDVDKLQGSIDELHEKLAAEHARLSATREELRFQESKVDVCKGKLTHIDASDATKLHVEELSLDDKLALANSKLDAVSKKLSSAEQKHLELTQKLEKLVVYRPPMPSIPLDELMAKMKEISSEKDEIGREMGIKTADLARGRQALQTIQSVPCEGKFPTCKFIADAIEFQTDCGALTAAISELRHKAFDISKQSLKFSDLEVAHRGLLKWEKEHSQCQLEIERTTGLIRELQRDKSDINSKIEGISSRLQDVRNMISPETLLIIENVKDELREAELAVSDNKRIIEGCLRNIGSLDSMRTGYEKAIDELNDAKKAARSYELLADATGKGGLPYRILTKVLPLINHEISMILSGVTKFSIFFEDDPDTQSVSLFIRYGDYRSRPLGLGSGAEKFIASLAVRCALLSVSSLPKTDILIIDEGFGKLDPEHLEALQRMFEYLKGAFGTVFIVSHVDFMRDIVDHSIEISSRDGYAHVSVT